MSSSRLNSRDYASSELFCPAIQRNLDSGSKLDFLWILKFVIAFLIFYFIVYTVHIYLRSWAQSTVHVVLYVMAMIMIGKTKLQFEKDL